MTTDPSELPTRRAVLKRGAFLAGAATIGTAGFAGTAAASCPELCPRTPGYWANHPENWPTEKRDGECTDEVADVTLCGVTGLDLRDYLLEPPKGRKNIIMAKHLIAAQLNLWVSGSTTFEDAGCRDDVIQTVEDATEWMQSHGCLDGVQRQWDGGEELKDTLEAFNEGRLCECTLDSE